MRFYLLAVAVVLIAALVAFGVPYVVGMHGTLAIVFIVLMLLIGLGAAAAILILHFRAKKKSEEGETAIGADTGELDVLLNDANRKLRESQQGAKSLDGLPLVYILGDTGAAKTTTVLQSGLDPELVAGTASREGDSGPTPVLNLWFTRLSALLELGASVRHSNPMLTRLVERTRAKAYRSAFGTGAAARAAIVCVSTEQLMVADGGTALMASARATGAQLREMSRLLGTTLPVYVIVTKLDRVPHFEEYVRNLSQEEVRQILGAALPKSEASAGLYADEATRKLTGVLDGLCYQLGEFRVEMLDRETEPRNAGGVYEFPREFGKLRKSLNQYLVELSKPSHLSANPYLRGFFFTGIRAQIVERMANAPAPVERAPQDAGATQYLNITVGRQALNRPPSQPQMVASRVPQWTFLPRLLPEVILGDKSALSATSQTAPARLFRRILFGTLAGLFLIYILLLVVSFFNNLGVEHQIENAAKALPVSPASASTIPSLSDLQNLDKLRQVIVQLDGWQDGAPWSYRWGLYQGDKLDQKARTIYFNRFRPMMLNPTQASWAKFLHDLPDAPPQGADYSLYNNAYGPLKAYLITAGNHEKSSPQGLDPTFMDYWKGSRNDPDELALAQKQVDFYATELARKDPYDIKADNLTVTHAQGYLHNFGDKLRIYQAMLNDANKKYQDIDFNRMYPGSATLVTEGHVVHGAYSKDGFAFMQDAMKNPSRYANGEQWVLGVQQQQTQGSGNLSADLATLYSADFLNQWHLFLTDAHVLGCGGLHDASGKLTTLAGANSPLLELFYTVSHNTAVSDTDIKTMFQPAQQMADPNNPDKLVGGGNQQYVAALTALSSSVDSVSTSVAQNPPSATDPAAYASITTAVTAAKQATDTSAQSFNRDDPQYKVGSTVKQLMLEPILCVSKIPPSPGGKANKGGEDVCHAVNSLLGKFPFAHKSPPEATLAEANQVFAPGTGSVWKAYDGALNTYLVPQMALYVIAPNPPQQVNSKFKDYFNKVAHVTSALYPLGAKNPSLNFTLKFLPSPGTNSATFIVDGHNVPIGASTTWNGETAQKASLLHDSSEDLQFTGTWSLFQLVRVATITKSAGGYRLDYHLDTYVQGVKTGGPGKVVSFELSGPGADMLVGDAFSGLGCVGPVVK